MESAALNAVLLLSRALGAAPASRDADARWRVSRALLLYSGLLSTLVGVYLVAYSAHAVLTQSGPALALSYVRAASRCGAALALAMGARSAPARLRRAARTAVLLRQIKAMLPRGQRKDQKRALALMLSSFASCLVTRAVDILTGARCFPNVFTMIYQCATIFAYFIESLIVLQIILIARQVAGSLAAINDGMKELAPDQSSQSSMTMLEKKDNNIENEDIVRKLPKVAWEASLPESENPIINLNTNQIIVNDIDYHSHLTTPPSQYELSAAALRRRAARYAALCDAVREANAVDGLYMAAVLVLFSLRLGIILYEIILWGLLVDQLNISYLTRPLLACVLLLVNLIIIIEPFHTTHVQMQRTHFLVINLKFCCRGDDSVTNELDLFLRLLKLNKAAYSPLGLCTLERSLTVTIFATITTYLVLALTYGPEVKDPALFVIHYYNETCRQF